jgi:amino acid adenylation domain-containing protein
VGPEEKVAFQLPRTEFVYVAMLGILKAGVAYVPLDPSYPGDRVSFILEDCAAKLLISSASIFEGTKAEVEKSGVKVELSDDLLAALEKDPACPRPTRAETGQTRENLAYIIYTSGTTGRPKGCLIEHRNICNEIRSAASVYGVVEKDRVFQGFSVAFDASLEEIWMAFFNGCTLVVGTKEIMQSGAKFADMLSLFQVSVLSCVPTLLSMVEKDIPTLRVIIVGGEACPKDLMARWYVPGRAIFNSYGPTEATVIATCDRMMPNAPVTIGSAIPNYKTFIVDDSLKLLPFGEQGELCIGGPGVARGYLNRDDLTKAKFVEIETLVPGAMERVYRTGDLARFDAYGDIEFLGRADDQVKLRGFRIELSEIESELMQCVGVLSAAVALREDLQQLAAYVVVREGHTLQRRVVIQKLKERLPAYMTPSWLDVVDALPSLVSGKVNRKLLPPPKTPLVDDEREIVAPRDEAERAMLALWEELFSRKGLSIKDDFFLDLGGHSMLAAKLVSKLRALPGCGDAAMSDVYQSPTIESLAKALTEKAASAGAAGETGDKPPEFLKRSTLSFIACGACQAVGLFFVLAMLVWLWLGPFLVFDYLTDRDFGLLPAAAVALGLYVLSLPLLPLLPFLAKWLCSGA